jgi:hypothetical protein
MSNSVIISKSELDNLINDLNLIRENVDLLTNKLVMISKNIKDDNAVISNNGFSDTKEKEDVSSDIKEEENDEFINIFRNKIVKINELENKDQVDTVKDQVDTVKDQVVKKMIEKNNSKKEDIRLCPYKFIKGINEGKICNSRLYQNKTFCSKHSKFEETGQKDKKSIPSVSSTKKLVINKGIRKDEQKEKNEIQIIKKKELENVTNSNANSNVDKINLIGKNIEDVISDLFENDLSNVDNNEDVNSFLEEEE